MFERNAQCNLFIYFNKLILQQKSYFLIQELTKRTIV
jgi:hypothetical protein